MWIASGQSGWWQILRQCRPGTLRDQVGSKVCALLEGRLRQPVAVQYLFSDDAERDPDALSLYAMPFRGDLGPGEAVDHLARAGAREDNRRCILPLLDRLRAVEGARIGGRDKIEAIRRLGRFGPGRQATAGPVGNHG